MARNGLKWSVTFAVLAVLPAILLQVSGSYGQSRDEDGTTDLMRAARDGEAGDFRSALKRSNDVNARDVYGWTALMYAAARGDEGMVKKLLSENANMDISDDDGRTALMHAVNYGHDGIAKRLVRTGADVDHRDGRGARALGIAWAKGNDKIVDLLEKSGASPLAAEDRGADLYRENFVNAPVLLNQAESFRLLHDLLPFPSHDAMQLKMRILVGANGKVKKVRVLIGMPDGITEAARKIGLSLSFRPAAKNGEYIEAWFDYGISRSAPERVP